MKKFICMNFCCSKRAFVKGPRGRLLCGTCFKNSMEEGDFDD